MRLRASTELKERIALTKAFSVIIIAMLLFTKPSWSTDGAVDMTVEYAGLVLLVLAAYGRILSQVYISGRKKHELVTSGPYAITRNPLYLFSFIGGVGFGLASGSLTVLFLVVLAFVIYYPSVMRAEERKLESIHGQKFKKYAEAVPLFFPRTLSGSEPEQYDIYSRKFRIGLIQSMWFIWAFIVLQVIEKLHHEGVLPVFMVIP